MSGSDPTEPEPYVSEDAFHWAMAAVMGDRLVDTLDNITSDIRDYELSCLLFVASAWLSDFAETCKQEASCFHEGGDCRGIDDVYEAAKVPVDCTLEALATQVRIASGGGMCFRHEIDRIHQIAAELDRATSPVRQRAA